MQEPTRGVGYVSVCGSLKFQAGQFLCLVSQLRNPRRKLSPSERTSMFSVLSEILYTCAKFWVAYCKL